MYQDFLYESVLHCPCNHLSHMVSPSQHVCNFRLQNKHPEPGPRSDNEGAMFASYLQIVVPKLSKS